MGIIPHRRGASKESDAVVLSGNLPQVSLHPLNRSPQTLSEVDLRSPPQKLSRQRGSGEELRDFAGSRPYPTLFGCHLQGPSYKLLNQLDNLSDRMALPVPQDDGFAQDPGGEGGVYEAPHRILDEGEVSPGGEGTEPEGLTSQGLDDYRGDHRSQGLAGAIGVEGSENGYRKVEAVEIAEGEGIAGDLRGGVGRLGVKGMVFVHGEPLGGSVDFARRGDHDPGGLVFKGRGEDVHGRKGVVLHDLPGVEEGVRDTDQGSQVEDGLYVRKGPLHRFLIPKVSEVELQVLPGGKRNLRQESLSVSGGVAEKRPYPGPFTKKGFGQMAAYEATRAGDEDQPAFPTPFHRKNLPHSKKVIKKCSLTGGRGCFIIRVL